jgi:regulator of cell morphogenesis and NO signaling
MKDQVSAPESHREHPTADTRLASVALRNDACAAVLDRHRLDFCCRGARTLGQACKEAGLDVDRVLAELHEQEMGRAAAASVIDWHARPLAHVVDFVVETHHAFTRTAIARIAPLSAKVVSKHGDRHPELVRAASAFAEVAGELTPHMLREERVLFPYIRALESPLGAAPPPFGTVRHPVAMMMFEHDRCGELLAEIAEATGGFTPPADACASYRALYAALAELRRDLVKHISIENNVIFPRAVSAEDRWEHPERAQRPQSAQAPPSLIALRGRR